MSTTSESTTPNASEPEMIRVRYAMRGGQHGAIEATERVYVLREDVALGDVASAADAVRLATINASAAEWAAMALGGRAYVLDGERAYRIERAG